MTDRAQAVTLPSLLSYWAACSPERPAILAPGRSPLSYGDLRRHVELLSGQLRASGIGSRDRVAVVVPNGPEAAVSFLAAGSAAACAPLNPAYKVGEFESYLRDLQAKALVADAEQCPAAVEAARRLAIPVIRIAVPPGAPAGLLRLEPAHIAAEADGGPGPEDVALLLHTSGTTSRPKLVPLTHRNLCASARNIAATLELVPADRCLNVMPLFHIHGLVAAVLASLYSGASVVCSPGFLAAKFLEWIAELQPTWYTAAPTIHQAALSVASQARVPLNGLPLRLIRSCSAALPPRLMAELEEAFQVPVIEAYGMTEAAHQVASNRLGPGGRLPGSVGWATGVEIAILGEGGEILPPGMSGEVAIRGESVIRGYLDNPEANKSAFCDGWFRTGDQGRLDEDGRLFLNGRLKEIINRGGEKISPREIDEVLLMHPGVAQAVAFAIPHRTLGEEVGAAVVLKPGAAVSPQALRQFASEHLAEFKVPRVIRLVDEIPKGPTGKLQRIGLAAALGINPAQSSHTTTAVQVPRTELERRLAALWSAVLGLDTIGVTDDFFELGGNSVLAALVVARMNEDCEAGLSLAEFLASPSISAIAELLESSAKRQFPEGVIPIRGSGTRPALFCHPGASGSLTGFFHVAASLDPEQPVFGFLLPSWSPEIEKQDIMGLAETRIAQIQAIQPRGPYFLAGACLGGVIAFEIARQLEERGEQVGFVALVDAFNPGWYPIGPASGLAARLSHGLDRTLFHLRRLTWGTLGERKEYFRIRLSAFLDARRQQLGGAIYCGFRKLGRLPPRPLRRVVYPLHLAERRYRPLPYYGRAILFQSTDPRAGVYPVPLMGWQEVLRGETLHFHIPGGHEGLLVGANAAQVAGILSDAIRRWLPVEPRPISGPAPLPETRAQRG